ncbi:BEL1-like homeodomain protein 9 [Phragmites australis]|uniref:BEL1-like homeodomain protein 9 n=1 Tax=Phragmites australis TaxID=29695 RepID=UPI002D764CCC|nr:BEL1-like homeodomain protein 9 [Phragmites australis]
MSSAAGAYGGGAGSGAEPHCHGHGHGDFLLHHHAQHVAGHLYHVPQHSRREKLRFPSDAAADSTTHASAPYQQQPGAWPPPPPAFYSYASSTSSYSPHSPTLAQAQLVAHGLAVAPLPQIPTQNFALSLSSSSSNPPPPPRRQLGVPSGSYGPFTGYTAVLARSRFLAPAEKLLEEICNVGGAAAHVDRSVPDDCLLDADPMEAIDHDMDGGDRAASDAGPISGAEQQWRKTRLISMMEEVCKRYRQYYQQVQVVIASFDTVAGFSNAAPFAAMALKVMTKHFKCLKGMIQSQLRNTTKYTAAKEGLSKDIAMFGLAAGGSAAAGFQRGSSVTAFGQPQNIWRPQRGLPERAVSVLRAWLFEHFLHPYPTDGDKQMLAKQTGLTRNQVSNWFINARVRLWKPMVEEIHNLEMRQMPKHPALDKSQHGMYHQTQHSSECSGKPSDPSDSQFGQSSSITRNHNIPASQGQGFPDELSQMSHSIQGQVTFAYNGLSTPHSMTSSQHQQQVGAVGSIGGTGNGGVSLTLGLHQNNNRVCIAEPLPASLPPNLAHRFGLEDVSDAAYVMGSFGGQDRHFAKESGGHFVHDFVG